MNRYGLIATLTLFFGATAIGCGQPAPAVSTQFITAFNNVYYIDGSKNKHQLGTHTSESVDAPEDTQVITNRRGDVMKSAAKELTVADWKNCTGTVSYFPTSPSAGKQMYTVVIDVAHCLPNAVYTAWFLYTNNGTRADNTLMTPVGDIPLPSDRLSMTMDRLPNTIKTNAAGAGHLARVVDAEQFFRSGVTPPGAWASVMPMEVPSSSDYEKASVIVSLYYHIPTDQGTYDALFATFESEADDVDEKCQGQMEPFSDKMVRCLNPSAGLLFNEGGKDRTRTFQAVTQQPGIGLSLLQP